MNFLEQSNKDKISDAVYLFVFAAVIVMTLLTGVIAESIAWKVFGHSLAGELPEGKSEAIKFALMLLPYLGGLVTLLLSVKFLNKRSILSIFTSRERFDWKRFLTSFSIWGTLLVVFMLFKFALDAPIEYQFNASKFFPLLLVALVLLPIQTAAEDLLFRGYMFQGVAKMVKSGLLAILILGAVFGYLHSGNPEVKIIGPGLLVFYVLSGVFMGILSHLDDGLELGMGYHAANNLFGVLILSTDWQVFKTDSLFLDHSPPVFGWDIIISLAVIQPLLIFVFYKIYRWKNVKEKLLN